MHRAAGLTDRRVRPPARGTRPPRAGTYRLRERSSCLSRSASVPGDSETPTDATPSRARTPPVVLEAAVAGEQSRRRAGGAGSSVHGDRAGRDQPRCPPSGGRAGQSRPLVSQVRGPASHVITPSASSPGGPHLARRQAADHHGHRRGPDHGEPAVHPVVLARERHVSPRNSGPSTERYSRMYAPGRRRAGRAGSSITGPVRHADPEREAAPAERLRGGRLLGERERMAGVDGDDADTELDPRGCVPATASAVSASSARGKCAVQAVPNPSSSARGHPSTASDGAPGRARTSPPIVIPMRMAPPASRRAAGARAGAHPTTGPCRPCPAGTNQPAPESGRLIRAAAPRRHDEPWPSLPATRRDLPGRPDGVHPDLPTDGTGSRTPRGGAAGGGVLVRAGGAGRARRCGRTGPPSTATAWCRACSPDNRDRDWSTPCSAPRCPHRCCSPPDRRAVVLHPRRRARHRPGRGRARRADGASTAASHTLEDVAARPGRARVVPALLADRRRRHAASSTGRAHAGYSALVVTLDTWTLGWRPRDLDRAYLPFLRGVGTAIPFSDPAFRSLAAPPARGGPRRGGRPAAEALHRDRVGLGPGRPIRAHWDGPLLVKGIQRPEDARIALDAGVDGVIVSNHGGRQIDRGDRGPHRAARGPRRGR